MIADSRRATPRCNLPRGVQVTTMHVRAGTDGGAPVHGGGDATELDGVRITGTARLDSREDLARLAGAPANAGDLELILRAWLARGPACLEQIAGEFAFVVDDPGRRELAAARDPFGIMPLYYAARAGTIAIAGALGVLLDPSDAVDDLAIADFLLFGSKRTPDATSWRDVRQVPPAHLLTWSAERGPRLRRYWTLPVEEPLHLRGERDYVETFRALLRIAVEERAGDSVSVFMSGGLDSPALAAAAAGRLGGTGGPGHRKVRAFTLVHGPEIDPGEERYARAAAAALGVPLTVHGPGAGDEWPSAGAWTPEPIAALDRAADTQCLADMAAHGPVALYGEGPDNALLYEWQPYLSYLWRRRRVGRLASAFAGYLRHHRRVPLGRRALPAPAPPNFPAWLAPDLVRELGLRERWHDQRRPLHSEHPVHPRAYASFADPVWTSIFEGFSPEMTGVPVAVRHPYLDLRVLRFLLRVPAVPWGRRKLLLRRALRGVLPAELLARGKTPLARHPEVERVRRIGLPPVTSSAALARYGDATALSRGVAAADAEAALRFVALSRWLAGRPSSAPPPSPRA